MGDDELVLEAKRLIDALAASPRFAGSEEEGASRALCTEKLRKAGFTTTETGFDFSEWPGRFGIPLIAAWLVSSIALVAAAGSTDPGLGGLAFMATTGLGTYFMFKRRANATRDVKWLRSRSTNLEAARGTPKTWLVAHLDSKSQSVSMLLRVSSNAILMAAFGIETAVLFLAQLGILGSPHLGWFAIAGIIAAIPSLLCFVGNESPGALDNSTGVAAVILAARLVSPEKPVGVLITSGEELDLAGARAWSDGRPKGALMINCDTIDEAGTWRCMYVSRPQALALAAEKAAKKLGLGLRMGKVIPGIITDSMAFEAAGLPSVTLSRGTVKTLARLHTKGDSADRLTGSGAATAARILAQMVEELA
ncbi:MAG: M28 family peptidase [Gemmatimonadaceae bacterium]|nr:M28 family peptidase [Gemmatimonadaceae bacterium]